MIRPTVAIVMDSRRKKSGDKYPIKLRITFLRQQQYYPTGIDLTSDEFLQMSRDKSKRLFADIKYRLQEQERKAWSIINSMQEFSFNDFNQKVELRTKDVQNAYSFFENYITSLRKEERLRTAESYHCCLISLSKFQAKLSLRDVNASFLQSYEKWMIKQGKSITTVGIYLRNLRAIYNMAISEGFVPKENYPFTKHKYVIPAANNIKKALSLDEVKRIFQSNCENNSTEEFYRDLWLFSYLCNGINIKDICLLKNRDIVANFLRYNRSKTVRSTRASSSLISVFILDHAKRIIEKWRNDDGRPEAFLFGLLKPEMDEVRRLATIRQTVKQINKYVSTVAIKVGIEKKITTYHARHSFATILKKSGASIEYISESLGHQSIATTRSYLDSFEDDTKKSLAAALVDF
jgi:integrase/recombinase XerD